MCQEGGRGGESKFSLKHTRVEVLGENPGRAFNRDY